MDTSPLPPSSSSPPHPSRETIVAWIEGVHDSVTDLFTRLDGRERFREDAWKRPGGGGGWARVLVDGALFEKAGVNRSVVEGELPPEAAARLGGGSETIESPRFFAAGVSVVVHPRSPHVPTVHLNVRWFEISDGEGRPVDGWYGGGTDLTPMYPEPEDAVFFHSELKRICDPFGPGLYPRFKEECDRYFTNAHRGGEARGVGGIFFDHLRPGASPTAAKAGEPGAALHAFVDAVGRSLEKVYAPIVERRRERTWTEEERNFQLQRRGRYVEFNLLHDRGTVFGLRTNARTESVLMSLPPLARWDYAPSHAPGSFQDRLIKMLEPREWAEGAGSPAEE